MAQTVKSIVAEIGLDSTKFTNGASEVKQQTSNLKRNISDIQTAITGMTAGLAAAGVVMKQAFEIGKEGAELSYTREKFDRLAESIGTTADVLENDLKNATKGLVADSTLIGGATDLMSLGLAKTHDQAVRLTTVVGALNMDMNQLTLTLSNQTTMRFDSLGVSVDGFDERLQKLKDTGMDVNEAFTEAFLQQAEQQIATVGDVADSAVAPFLRLETSLQNLGDTAKEKVAPGLTAAADALNILLNWSEKVSEGKAALNQRLLTTTDNFQDYTIALFEAKEEAFGLTRGEEKLLEKMREGIVIASDTNTLNEDYARILAHVQNEMEGIGRLEYDAIETKTKLSAAADDLTEKMARQNGEYSAIIDNTTTLAEADMELERAVLAAAFASAEHAAELGLQLAALDAVTDALYNSGSAADEYARRMEAAKYNTAVNREELENLAETADVLFANGLITEEDIISANAKLGISATLQEMEGGIISQSDAVKTLREDFGLTWSEAQEYISGAIDPLEEFSELLGGLDVTEMENVGLSALDLASDLGVPLGVANEIIAALDALNGKSVNSSVTIHTNYTYSGGANSGLGSNVLPTGLTDYYPMAGGGSFTIPSGFGGDTYPLAPGVRANSGEVVNVSNQDTMRDLTDEFSAMRNDLNRLPRQIAQAIAQMGV